MDDYFKYNELICIFHYILVFQTSQFVNCEDGFGKVVLVNVLFKNGNSAPIDPYPNDPYKSETFWSVPFGELTNIGKNQEFELGQWLRTRYDSLLTATYSQNILHAISSDEDRTLMSAQCCLAGLYPPSENQSWNPDINWQPIPIHTRPKRFDNLISFEKPCPAYAREFQDFLKTREFNKINDSFKDIYEVVNKYTGRLSTTLEQLYSLYSLFYIQTLNKKTLPAWTQPIYPERLMNASVWSIILPTYNTRLARLKSGPLLTDMINNMKLKIENNTKSKSFYIYSGHDTTESGLMNSMNVFNKALPPFASCFLMELTVNSAGEHHVMMFYRNLTYGDPTPLILPGCTLACPFNKFMKILEPIIIHDWDSECKSGPGFNIFLVIGILVVIIVAVLVVVSVDLFIKLKKRGRTNRTTETPATDAPQEST